MQPEITKILKDNFPPEELFINAYHDNCICYAISKDSNMYIVGKETLIDFEVACVAFVRRDNNEICMFVTAKKYRNKGFAVDMLTYLNEIYPKTSLWVRTTNKAALNLYQNKMGYRITELRVNFYEYTGVNGDGFHMEKINSK